MQVIETVAHLREWRRTLGSRTLGLVPTMGALHAGHLSLVEASRARCGATLASIFVNPLQFGPNEDFAKYPRPFEEDRGLLARSGCDALFAPDARSFYPDDRSTAVIEESVGAPLCGERRPGHFRGVATVVLKLFNASQPNVAFFGQKDAQQCAVLERLVRDLDVPVEIARCPTVREADGLALSSRNAYLDPEERRLAPFLYRSLRAAAEAATGGEIDCRKLEERGRRVLEGAPALRVQYWEIRHARTMRRLERLDGEPALALVAAAIGKTRLIDNEWMSAKGQVPAE